SRRLNELTRNQLLPDSTFTMLPVAWIVKILAVPFGYRWRLKNARHATQFLRQETAAADRRTRRAPPQIVLGAKRLRLPVFLRRPAAFRQRQRERHGIRLHGERRPQDFSSGERVGGGRRGARVGGSARPRASFHRALRGFQDGVIPGLRRACDAARDEARGARAQRRYGSHHRDLGAIESRPDSACGTARNGVGIDTEEETVELPMAIRHTEE